MLVVRVLLTTSIRAMKDKLQYIVLIAIAISLVYAGWLLKPASHITDVEYVEVPMSVDSANIITHAREGLFSREDAIEKFGQDIRKVHWEYKTHIDTTDTTIVDTQWVAIPYLSATDSASFSGFNLLDDDTVKYELIARVKTNAYFSPVNIIENTITIDSLNISIETKLFEVTLIDAVKKAWWLLPTGAFVWELAR